MFPDLTENDDSLWYSNQVTHSSPKDFQAENIFPSALFNSNQEIQSSQPQSVGGSINSTGNRIETTLETNFQITGTINKAAIAKH